MTQCRLKPVFGFRCLTFCHGKGKVCFFILDNCSACAGVVFSFHSSHAQLLVIMFLQRGSRVLRQQWQTTKGMGKAALGGRPAVNPSMPRWFSESRRLYAVKPVLLADIGEGKKAQSLDRMCKTAWHTLDPDTNKAPRHRGM